ncbi:hypothetical protein Q3G72_021032 [Acer saccharum]|nr:hypothetical protein Q3G72_021032 [Acer saccharum]
MASTKVQRIMTQPINLIFRFLQSKARIQIWLFEQKDMRIEGRIIGFDEYMNLVLDEAEEVNVKKNSRKTLGRILLKGDNITLMMNSNFFQGSGQLNFRIFDLFFHFCLFTQPPSLCLNVKQTQILKMVPEQVNALES